MELYHYNKNHDKLGRFTFRTGGIHASGSSHKKNRKSEDASIEKGQSFVERLKDTKLGMLAESVKGGKPFKEVLYERQCKDPEKYGAPWKYHDLISDLDKAIVTALGDDARDYVRHTYRLTENIKEKKGTVTYSDVRDEIKKRMDWNLDVSASSNERMEALKVASEYMKAEGIRQGYLRGSLGKSEYPKRRNFIGWNELGRESSPPHTAEMLSNLIKIKSVKSTISYPDLIRYSEEYNKPLSKEVLRKEIEYYQEQMKKYEEYKDAPGEAEAYRRYGWTDTIADVGSDTYWEAAAGKKEAEKLLKKWAL